jgi:drug/metabolite transporter (DMT)-like permease
MPARRPTFGVVLVVTAAVFFILNAGVSRVALRGGVDPAQLTTLRLTGTAALLLIIVLVAHRSALQPPQGRLALLLVAHGVVGVAGVQWAYYVAIDRLPVGMALLLEYQAPVIVALWAWLVQGEHVRRRIWLGLGLAMSGLAAATGIWRGLEFDAVGIAAGFVAAGCFAVYFLIGEHGVSTLDPLRMAVWSFGIGAIAMNLYQPVTDFPATRLDDQVDLLGALSGHTAPLWLVLGWIVVLGTLTPFCLELVALRHLAATIVTTLAFLEPIGVSALGWVWFGESLDPIGVIGVAAVVAGVLIAQSAREPEPAERIEHPVSPVLT